MLSLRNQLQKDKQPNRKHEHNIWADTLQQKHKCPINYEDKKFILEWSKIININSHAKKD